MATTPIATLAELLPIPAEDYSLAAEFVWQVLRDAAEHRNSEAALGGPDNQRNGYRIVGTGPAQAIQQIWPRLSTDEHRRVRNSVRKHLVESGNAQCWSQQRSYAPGVWWVAEEWAPIVLKRPGSARGRVSLPKRRTVTATVRRSTPDPKPEPEPTPDPTPAPEPFNLDHLLASWEQVRKGLLTLQHEGDRLRELNRSLTKELGALRGKIKRLFDE